MNRIISISIVCVAFAMCIACESAEHKAYKNARNSRNIEQNDKWVYICTGPYAYAYHYDEDCWALQNCSESIEGVYLSEIEDEREPCSECVY